jgi:hypothetical protein
MRSDGFRLRPGRPDTDLNRSPARKQSQWRGMAFSLYTVPEMMLQPDASNPFVSAAVDGFAVWWNGPRQAIHQWLQTRSPPLAELYLGANQLLSARTPGWTRFVAHAMREMVNRLPAVICGEEMNKGPLNYPQRVEGLAGLLETRRARPGIVEKDIDRDGVGLVAVPMSVVSELEQLVQDHRDASAGNRERALRMLRALVPESPPDASQLAWTASSWVAIGDWAHGQAHDQKRNDEEREADEIIRWLETLEGVLHGVTRPFFENKDDLDALLEDTNA